MDPDAIVIGAGHNGLVAACVLAQAGYRVSVLERRDVVGGACVTEELMPGVRISSAAYSFSLFRPEVLGALGLEKHGLSWYAKEPRMFVPTLDGRHYFIWRDAQRTLSEIGRIDAHDAEAYPRWNAFWDEVAAAVRPMLLVDEPPTLAEVERALGPQMYRMAIAGAAADTVRAFFDNPAIQGPMAGQGIIGTFLPPSAEGTAFVMTYHAFGGELVDGAGTWAFVRGGMGGVTTALESCARALGVDIRTGVSVTRIVIEAGRARGVELDDGTVVSARVVLSNADPKRTFLTLCEPETVPDDLRERARALDTTGSVIKLNMVLRELPDFLALPGTEAGPQHAGTIELSPSIDALELAHREAAAGRVSSHPFMEMFMQSVTDDSLAPEGIHVASAFAQYAPGSVPADAWEPMRAAAGDAVIDEIARYAPNIREAIITHEVLGPADLEARFGLTGGNIFHGELTPDQIFSKRFSARTPIPGLYLCGSGAHPGGAVTGAPGWNAARAAIVELA